MAETRVDGQFQLSGAWNFRDVGGLRMTDGKVVRDGVLFRSSELTRLDDHGRAELLRLGVARVIDLRGDSEIARSGADRLPEGVLLRNIPYDNHKEEKAPHEGGIAHDEEAQRAYMMRAYTSFASLDGARAAIHEVITTVGAGKGPVLVHCAAGKDRAGWTIATVLRAAGVSEADIVSDFLRSNAGIDPLRKHVQAIWPVQADGSVVDPSDAVLGVTETYYRHGLEVVDQVHGSFEGYLDAIGVGEADVADLKSALSDT